jgi:hypothetical protein
MTKASRQVLFSATAVSVCAFALGNLGIVSKHDGILAALAPDGASTVSASALVTAPTVMPLGLPDAKLAKAVLSASLLHHHPQWMDVPMGASMIRTFVIYPDLSGRLPVAVVTDQNEADERLGAGGRNGGSQRGFHHRSSPICCPASDQMEEGPIRLPVATRSLRR